MEVLVDRDDEIHLLPQLVEEVRIADDALGPQFLRDLDVQHSSCIVEEAVRKKVSLGPVEETDLSKYRLGLQEGIDVQTDVLRELLFSEFLLLICVKHIVEFSQIRI